MVRAAAMPALVKSRTALAVAIGATESRRYVQADMTAPDGLLRSERDFNGEVFKHFRFWTLVNGIAQDVVEQGVKGGSVIVK